MPNLLDQLVEATNLYCRSKSCNINTTAVYVEPEYDGRSRQMRVYHGKQMLPLMVPPNVDLEARKTAIYAALDAIHPPVIQPIEPSLPPGTTIDPLVIGTMVVGEIMGTLLREGAAKIKVEPLKRGRKARKGS